MRYAVIGSRSFQNYDILNRFLERHYISLIVSGGAAGADTLASRYAIENNIPLTVIKPNWVKYPKTAGFVRNKEIIRAVDIVVAFYDGFSSGTTHSLNYAEKLNKKTFIVTF